jgi:hypothetical protein
MIDLGSTEFYLAVASVPERQLKRLSTSLFDSWESFADQSLALPDYSLFLQVEEGSVKGVAQVGVVLGALYVGIGNYGDFVAGMRTIQDQVVATSDYLTGQAERVFSCTASRASSQKRGGSLAVLQRLFAKVQKGELTPEEATARAEALLGEEASTVPGFMLDLSNALRTCPRHHEQQLLPFLDAVEGQFSESSTPQRQPRLPRSSPDLGPPLLLRVEVWRESKKKRKHTRVVKL